MGQVSRKYDHNPPNVRSRCILAKLYKAKKHLDQGGREKEERKQKERKTILLYLLPRIELEDEHLANFQAISS